MSGFGARAGLGGLLWAAVALSPGGALGQVSHPLKAPEPLHWNDVEHPGPEPDELEPSEPPRVRLRVRSHPLSPVPLVAAPEPEPEEEFESWLPSLPPPDLEREGQAAAERYVSEHLGELKLREPLLRLRGVHAPDRLEDDGQRVARMITAHLGRFNVQRGLVDPYFSEVRKQFEKQWDPEPAVTEKSGLEGYFSLQREKLQAQLDDWGRAASGLPGFHDELLEGEGPGRSDRDIEPDPGNPELPANADYSRQLREANQVMKTALVALSWDAEGKLTRIELVRPSDDPAMDHELLDELYDGRLSPPRPPAEGRGIHPTIRTLWAFRLTVFIAPPAPVATGEFDETALFDPSSRDEAASVNLPLQRKVTKHVELVAVE